MITIIRNFISGIFSYFKGFLILYIWFLVALGIIGTILGNWKAAILAGILIGPFAFIAYKSKSLRAFLAFIIVIIFFVAVILGFGIIPQKIQESLKNIAGDHANLLHKRSAQSEAVSGMFASVKEDTFLLDGKNSFYVCKGQKVLVLKLDAQKANENSEGMSLVMLPNDFGHFSNGQRGYVPTRVLSLFRQETVSDGRYRVCWGNRCAIFVAQKEWDNLIFISEKSQYRNNEYVIFRGTETSPGEYYGTWEFVSRKNPMKGYWKIKFDSRSRASGILYDNGTEITLVAEKL